VSALGPQQLTLAENYGVDFERHILWLLLFDLEFADTVYPAVQDEVYEVDSHALLYSTAQALYILGNSKAPGYVDVITELIKATKQAKPKSKGAARLGDAVRLCNELKLQPQPPATTCDYVRKTFSTFCVKAKTRLALVGAIDLWERDDFDEILSSIDAAVHSKERTIAQDLGIDFKQGAAKIVAYSQTHRKGHHAPIDLPILDNLMRGGLEPGTLGLIMGPAARGKSLFLVQAAISAALAGLNVAVITLELSARDYAMRFDARLTGIPINEIAARPTQHAQAILQQTKALGGQLHIKGWGSSDASTGDLRVWLKALESVAKFIPDVIIVDYADLLQANAMRGDRPDLGLVIRQLRQIANDFHAALWTASQTRRSSYTSEIIKLEDVAEDIQKVHVADVIIGLCQTSAERALGKMRFAMLKNRLGGGEGTIVDCDVSTSTMLLRQCATQARVQARRMTAGIPLVP